MTYFGNRTAEVPLTSNSLMTDRRDHEGELFFSRWGLSISIRVSDDSGYPRFARLTRTASAPLRTLEAEDTLPAAPNTYATRSRYAAITPKQHTDSDLLGQRVARSGQPVALHNQDSADPGYQTGLHHNRSLMPGHVPFRVN